MRNHAIGLVLAGGQGKRLGKVDKAFVEVGGHPLISYVIETLRPQLGNVVINANDDPARFVPFGLPVVADPIQPPIGPLGGLFAGMTWARQNMPAAEWMISTACDTPFIPDNLVAALLDDARNADIVRASSGGRQHHVIAAWRLTLVDDLERAIGHGTRRMIDWIESGRRVRNVDFPEMPFDPFFNINRSADLVRAEGIAANRPEPLSADRKTPTG